MRQTDMKIIKSRQTYDEEKLDRNRVKINRMTHKVTLLL